jgi:hypothetical protein
VSSSSFFSIFFATKVSEIETEETSERDTPNHWYDYQNREHQHVGSRSKW